MASSCRCSSPLATSSPPKSSSTGRPTRVNASVSVRRHREQISELCHTSAAPDNRSLTASTQDRTEGCQLFGETMMCIADTQNFNISHRFLSYDFNYDGNYSK